MRYDKMKIQKTIIIIMMLTVLTLIFSSCSRRNKINSEKNERKNPALMRTVEGVSESAPLTYEIDKNDEKRLLVFSGQKEVVRIDRVEKIISVGQKLYVLRSVPVEDRRIWPAKILMIECNSGRIWSFDYEASSFYADEDFLIINRFGDRIENYLYVDVLSARDYSISASENLFAYLKSFPPDKISSEFSEKSGAAHLQFSDKWGEVFAKFSFDKSSLTWESVDCNYSKDFPYVPSDAKFCEVNKYMAYSDWTINDELKICLEDNSLRILNPLINSEIYSRDFVLAYKLSYSKEKILIIGQADEGSKNIEVFDLANRRVIKSFEASECAICDDQISRLLYKAKSADVSENLHCVDLEKSTDEIISLKKCMKDYKRFADFDFVSFKYPECELLFVDSDGLQYYAKINFEKNDSEVVPANRYKPHDLSKYPGLH